MPGAGQSSLARRHILSLRRSLLELGDGRFHCEKPPREGSCRYDGSTQHSMLVSKVSLNSTSIAQTCQRLTVVIIAIVNVASMYSCRPRDIKIVEALC